METNLSWKVIKLVSLFHEFSVIIRAPSKPFSTTRDSLIPNIIWFGTKECAKPIHIFLHTRILNCLLTMPSLEFLTHTSVMWYHTFLETQKSNITIFFLSFNFIPHPSVSIWDRWDGYEIWYMVLIYAVNYL